MAMGMMKSFLRLLFSIVLLPSLSSSSSSSCIAIADEQCVAPPPPPDVCIIGAGVAGSSLAHFLRRSPSPSTLSAIRIFERSNLVGGRTATITLAGDTFEAGGSVIHPKNFHALHFARLLNLTTKLPGGDGDSTLGIWDGHRFLFKSLILPWGTTWRLWKKIASLLDSLRIFKRYGLSLLKMEHFVNGAVDGFTSYYNDVDSRPVFETVEEMLSWAGLYSMTKRSLQDELVDAGLNQLLISELATVITRVNYGQNVTMSGLAGAVSLAGSQAGLWSVEGGNWQLAAGLVNHSKALLHLREEITSISSIGDHYELKSAAGNSYECGVAVVATPLDELDISFSPPISIPKRKLQHTHATFVRGSLNHEYFGLNSAKEIPDLVGTIEAADIPFSSVGVQRKYGVEDVAYKVFSRSALTDELLDRLFRVRKETIRINWAAYPHFEVPEKFAPFILDGHHLYYVNTFENAASTIETSAVAAENVARLILSRLSSKTGDLHASE